MWTYAKYAKIQASVQHGLYLFTCEIHSFNNTIGQKSRNLNKIDQIYNCSVKLKKSKKFEYNWQKYWNVHNFLHVPKICKI